MWVRFLRRVGAMLLLPAAFVAALPALAATETSVTTSPNPSAASQTFTITATVTDRFSPGDKVHFYVVGIGEIGMVGVDGDGHASYSTSLPPGTFTIEASYFDGHSSDGENSSSGSTTHVVTDNGGAATGLIEDFFKTRAELLLGNGPDLDRRLDRLNGVASGSANPAAALMGLMPIASGGPRTVSGSLGAIEQAVADRGETAPFDVWFEGTYGRHAGNGGAGGFGIAYLGADYLVSPDFLVGALFQLDQVGFDADTGDASASGTGWMIGPYVTGRFGDNLYFDARAAAGRSANEVSPFGTYRDDVDATRWLVDASLSGRWGGGSWTFEPKVRLAYFEESSDGYTDGMGVDVPSVKSGTGQLTYGPGLSYRFVTDGQIEVVAGARLDGVLDFGLDGGDLAYDGAHAELEASIDLGLSGGARLGASIKAGGLDEDDPRFLSGTIRVSAAIR